MESRARRRWMPIAVLIVLAALYWPAMFVATHLPIRTTPVGDPYSLDKLEHLGAFATLAALLSALGAAVGFKSWKRSAIIVCFIAVYALVDESTQVSPRRPEVLDWVADVSGSLLGVAVYSCLARLRSNSSQARPPAG
jgi:VanZ family protein